MNDKKETVEKTELGGICVIVTITDRLGNAYTYTQYPFYELDGQVTFEGDLANIAHADSLDTLLENIFHSIVGDCDDAYGMDDEDDFLDEYQEDVQTERDDFADTIKEHLFSIADIAKICVYRRRCTFDGMSAEIERQEIELI